uniref:Uncharacterized protein n=1 Tax=Zea mays TaxID=4577 RepID=A0A804MIR9_MAIZE
MAVEDAAQLLTLLAPLLVVAIVAAVIASAWADGEGVRAAMAQADAQAGEDFWLASENNSYRFLRIIFR